MKKGLNNFYKNKKYRNTLIIFIIILAIIGTFGYFKFSDEGTQVSLTTVKKGNIVQNFETNAVIKSGSQSEFKIIDGTKVESVNVALGDNVKKGDVLATFDVSTIEPILAQKQKDYNNALRSYNDTVKNENNAALLKKNLKSQINNLNAEIAVLQSQKSSDPTTNVTPAESLTPEKLQSILQASNAAGQTNFTDAEINQFVSTLGSGSTSDILNNISTFTQLDAQITNLQTQKSLLETEKILVENQNFSALENTYKALADSAKKSYDDTKAIVDALRNGWVAEYDGVITKFNIKAGTTYTYSSSEPTNYDDLLNAIKGLTSGDASSSDLTSAISQTTSADGIGTGMVVDNFNDFYASFTLSKYDALKVSLNQPAEITSVFGNYKGYVSYISPKASTGGSAISSITGASTNTAKLDAQAAVTNSDDSLVIGFDVKLLIKVAEKDNVLKIPIEAIQIDSNKAYVFVYDEKTKKIYKKSITLGLSSATSYEVKSGLDVGDIIVTNPSKDLTDGLKVYDKGAK